jgi:hypothetical protein
MGHCSRRCCQCQALICVFVSCVCALYVPHVSLINVVALVPVDVAGSGGQAQDQEAESRVEGCRGGGPWLIVHIVLPCQSM